MHLATKDYEDAEREYQVVLEVSFYYLNVSSILLFGFDGWNAFLFNILNSCQGTRTLAGRKAQELTSAALEVHLHSLIKLIPVNWGFCFFKVCTIGLI